MRDQDDQKYLKYKSISGMDCMPRLREPTPPRYDFYNQQSESDDDEIDPDCKQCIKYRSKYSNLKEKNLEMTKELEKAQEQIKQLRILQKVNVRNKKPIGMVDY